MSQFEEILEDQQENDDSVVEESEQLCVTNNQNLVLNSQDGSGNAIYYSPYRMNPAYRRPEDSDHGYSTMTPMGGDIDSEIVPYVDSASARIRLQRMQQKRQQQNAHPSSSIQSGSSRTSPIPISISSKAAAPINTSTSSPQCNSLSSSSEIHIIRGVTATKNQKLPFRQIDRSFSESSEENNTAATSNLQEPLDPTTMLPKTNRNQFIVSATVHMVET